MKYYTDRLRPQGTTITSEVQVSAYKGYGFGYIEDIREMINKSPLMTEVHMKEFVFTIRDKIHYELQQL